MEIKGLGREFVMVPGFDRSWEMLSLTDEDLHDLQIMLSENPEAGDRIPGTGGLRKIRYALPGRGKSHGARVIYVDFVHHELTYLITAYAKNEQVNLTSKDKKTYKMLIEQLERELDNK